MKTDRELRREGRHAAHEGAGIKTNPYEVGSLMWAAWRGGWEDGRKFPSEGPSEDDRFSIY